jgi:hypothetical protein
MSFRNSTTGAYPVSHDQVRAAHPNTSFPAYFEQADGFDWVQFADRPAYNPDTQYVEEGAPAFSAGRWRQTWVVKSFTPEQIDQRLKAKQQTIINQIVDAVQKRLDDFAASRNYNGILSACTYATSPTPKFAAEGQYCVRQRDATWAKCYQMLAEVQAGTRPMPSGYADIASELPVLEWPNA